MFNFKHIFKKRIITIKIRLNFNDNINEMEERIIQINPNDNTDEYVLNINFHSKYELTC